MSVHGELSTEDLWNIVKQGRGDRGVDGLLRSLCWGNQSGWDAMAALLVIVERQGERITELETEAKHLREAAAGDECGYDGHDGCTFGTDCRCVPGTVEAKSGGPRP